MFRKLKQGDREGLARALQVQPCFTETLTTCFPQGEVDRLPCALLKGQLRDEGMGVICEGSPKSLEDAHPLEIGKKNEISGLTSDSISYNLITKPNLT